MRTVRTFVESDGYYPIYLAHLPHEDPATALRHPSEGQYHRDCGLCWLGQCHTTALHRWNLRGVDSVPVPVTSIEGAVIARLDGSLDVAKLADLGIDAEEWVRRAIDQIVGSRGSRNELASVSSDEHILTVEAKGSELLVRPLT